MRARHAKAPILGRAMRRASAVAAALALALALGASAARADTLPTITTDPASEVGVTTAKLSGKANPNGAPGDGPTSWRLEYSPQGQEAWSQANAGTIEAPASEEGNDVPVEAIFGFGGELQPGQAYEFRLVAENGAGSAQTPTPYPTFTMGAATAPTLTIGPASDVQHTTAHLEGTIDPEGGNENPIGGPLPINWSFQVSTDGGASWSDASGGQGEVSASEPEGGGPIPALGDDPITIEADVSGLTPNKSYEVRLLARYAGKEAPSSSVGLTTLQITAPTVALDPIALDGEAATLTGTVNPNGFETSYWVEYRKQGAPDWVVQPFSNLSGLPEPVPLGAGAGPVAISQGFTAEPSSDYEYRLATRGLEGDSYDGPYSFTTPAMAPSVAAGTVGALTHDSARLTAYLDANNTPSTASFEYDADPSFASPATAPSGPGSEVTGNGDKIAYADATGLEPDTTYFWRVKAQSAEGSDEDEAPRSFDTYSPPPAPGSCPNEAIREAQGSTYLSNCRAWELVSTGGKSVPVIKADISRSGNRALYFIYGGTDQTSYGSIGTLLANRTVSGWRVSNALPPQGALGAYRLAFPVSASPEFDAITLGAVPGYVGVLEGPSQFFRYEPESGVLTPGALQDPAHPISNSTVVVASDDQTKVYALHNAPVTGQHAYLMTDAVPELVDLLPNGDVPGCGSTFAFDGESNAAANWVSDDGSRAFFMASDAACSTPYHLYMHEGGAEGATTLLAGPPQSGPDFGIGGTSSAGSFQATPDGSQVFFTTNTRITAEDGNETSDLYRHTQGEGNECLTCVVPGAEAAGSLVAQSGKRAYFLSTRALAPGATPGQTNVYVWRADSPGSVAFVAPALGGLGEWKTGGNTQSVIASFDGDALVFPSSRPELNTLTGRSNGGFTQLYRYDDRSGTLDCMTCPPPPREATSDRRLAGRSLYQLENFKPLSEDGDSFFFPTPEALVPEDVNDSVDVYEWHDGQAELVSDGRSGGKLTLSPASPDGRDVLFVQNASLTPDAHDASSKLYDARVGGGFPSLYEQPQAPCAGDGCRSAQGQPQGDATPATPSFSGPGNPRAKPPCAKGKVRKKARCVKRKPRKRSSKSRANSNRGGAK